MIKKFLSNRNRPGWRWDSRLKKYYSWGFDMWLSSGKRKRETGFLNRSDVEAAVSRIRQLEKEIKYGYVVPLESPTLEEACEKKLSLTASRHEYVRAKRVFGVLRLLAQVRRVTELKTEHIQRFVDLRWKEVKPQSVDREMKCISAMLRDATVHFPALAEWTVPRMPRLKYSKRRRDRVITAQEVTKVLTWLYTPQEGETTRRTANRRNVGHVFRVAFLTGARKGELCKLRWSQVDWAAGIVQVIGTKTENRSEQTTRPLAIDRALEAILRERQTLGHEFVFTRKGREVTDYYEIMREACKACGVTYGKGEIGGFVTHDARHTAVTRMLQAGVDLATIGSITGHGDATMILRYGHATTESQKRAMSVLENFAGIDALGDGLETVSSNASVYTEKEQSLVPARRPARRKA